MSAGIHLRAELDAGRRAKDLVCRVFLFAGIGIALGALATLLVNVFVEGRPRLTGDLVANMPSARPRRAGIQGAVRARGGTHRAVEGGFHRGANADPGADVVAAR